MIVSAAIASLLSGLTVPPGEPHAAFDVARPAAAIADSATAGTAAPDPFATLDPLDDDDLRAARGGYVVGGYQVEIGLLVEIEGMLTAAFVSDLEAVTRALARNGADTRVYDSINDLPQGITTLVVENTMDDATLAQTIQIDIALPTTGAGVAYRDGVSFNATLPAPVLPGTF